MSICVVKRDKLNLVFYLWAFFKLFRADLIYLWPLLSNRNQSYCQIWKPLTLIPVQLQGETIDEQHGENSAVVKSIKCLHSLYISGLVGSISRRREGKEGCYLHKTHDVPASCLCLDSDGPCFLGVFEWVAVRWWLGLEPSGMISSLACSGKLKQLGGVPLTPFSVSLSPFLPTSVTIVVSSHVAMLGFLTP